MAPGIGQHPVDPAQGVVARGARRAPVRGQVLPRFQDLLHHGPRAVRDVAEHLQVATGVPHTVRVVDPQPVHEALAEPAGDLRVGLVEDHPVLHAHAGQRGHGEEPAVVQLGVPPTPVDQLVVLAPVHLGGVVALGPGAVGEGIYVLVVAQRAVLDGERREVLVAVAQHRDQHLAVPGLPVHVERVRVSALTPFGEQRPPPRVLLRLGHALVVGDDVHHHAQARGVRGLGQRRETRGATALGVHLGGVHHVVAVVGAARGPQDR